MCRSCGRGYEEAKEKAFINAGHFMTGFFVVSGFALPALFAHLEMMTTQALFMGLAGGLIVYSTILVYLHRFHGKQDWDSL